LGGSWYVEALTDRMEAQAEAIFAQIRELGARRRPGEDHPIGPITSGLLAGIESGWFTDLIADAAFEHQRAMEEGRKRVVGVNVHTDAIETPLEILRVSHEVERDQVAVLSQRRAARDSEAVGKSLAILAEAARTDTNLVPVLIDAARAEATLGEMCNVLRAEWGTYREPI
jgi:methylmalonyl-CoA mutase N-terminal domain/subunit